MSKIRLGLLGCGRIAQLTHLSALTQLRHAALVVIAEPDEAAQSLARRMAPLAEIDSDYWRVLARRDVDGVIICLPSGMHATAAIEAFRQGKHVFLEKPVAITLEEARALRAARRDFTGIGHVGFNNRFDRGFNQVRQVLDDGVLGTIAGVRVSWCSTTRQLPYWKRYRESGGGVLLDLGSHLFDLVHFLFRRQVRQVWARLQSLHTEDDNAQVELTLDNGLAMQALLSSTSVQEACLEVFGDRGKLTYNRSRGTLAIRFPETGHSLRHRLGREARGVASAATDFAKAIRPGFEPTYARALQAFVDVVRGHQPPPHIASIDDGMRSLAVVLAAEQSARVGKPVTPSPVCAQAAAMDSPSDAGRSSGEP